MSDVCTLEGNIKKFLSFEAIRERFIPFSFFVNDEKRKKTAVLSLPENDS